MARPDHLPPSPRFAWLPPGARRLDFMVFYDQAHLPYVRYAQTRLGRLSVAREAVEAAFADLASDWPRALSSPRAPAMAWELLQRAIARHAVARVLPGAPPHELMVLHCGLGLPTDTVAYLLGRDPLTVKAHLAVARRTAAHPPHCAAEDACPDRSTR
ncbi:hypothetical protein ACFVT5_20970 [Streptomyces sp. NPDC058001]|uniref:hypothetical protein n=1 Tax=Streptomyces sp. NPDC058001 TaxID=3346300 RepID=UPI0036EECA68